METAVNCMYRNVLKFCKNLCRGTIFHWTYEVKLSNTPLIYLFEPICFRKSMTCDWCVNTCLNSVSHLSSFNQFQWIFTQEFFSVNWIRRDQKTLVYWVFFTGCTQKQTCIVQKDSRIYDSVLTYPSSNELLTHLLNSS